MIVLSSLIRGNMAKGSLWLMVTNTIFCASKQLKSDPNLCLEIYLGEFGQRKKLRLQQVRKSNPVATYAVLFSI